MANDLSAFDKAAKEARRAWEAVAPWHYSLDLEQRAAEKAACRAMREASTAYRHAYDKSMQPEEITYLEQRADSLKATYDLTGDVMDAASWKTADAQYRREYRRWLADPAGYEEDEAEAEERRDRAELSYPNMM